MVVNSRTTVYLIAFPVGLMGMVQLVFAALSFTIFEDHEEAHFLFPALIMILIAAVFIFAAGRPGGGQIGVRDSLLFATVTWIVMGFFGAIPFITVTGLSLTDAVFESISGLTTTGATVLSGLDEMPKSLLLYRQFLQWMGGLGIVIFVVAVLPMLNVGGMKLLKAETPGPIKGDKLTPRIADTAHYLWIVYVVITILCAIGYYLAGMTAYDAIAHSFTTVSTGGFSTHDASLGYFNSPVILLVADVFMLLGAINFALHFRVLQARRVTMYWYDEETRYFFLMVMFISVLIGILLLANNFYGDAFTSFNQAFFHLISFITSTGYGASNFTAWPAVTIALLIFAGYLGGCAGSTAGGNKIIRNILLIKAISMEMKRLVHPRGVFLIKYQGHAIESSILIAAMTYLFVAAFTSIVLTLVLMVTGLDFFTSFTAVAACVNVLGPAFGELGSNFQPVNDFGTWVLSVAMILGRLEYFTVLALLVPEFWRY